MPFGLLSLYHLYIVHDRDKPIPITTDVEDHIIVHIVGIREDAFHFLKSTPSGSFHGSSPFLEFIRRILVGFHRLFQMLSRHNLHRTNNTSHSVKCQGSNCVKPDTFRHINFFAVLMGLYSEIGYNRKVD